MFGMSKRRKKAAAKHEALQIGTYHVELIQERLNTWRACYLDLKRGLLEQAFSERVADLSVGRDPELALLLEIEALVLGKHWHESREDADKAFFAGLGAETLEVIQILGLHEPIHEHLTRHFAECTSVIDADVEATIAEALAKHAA